MGDPEHVLPRKYWAEEIMPVVFAFRLPFDLPLADGAGFTLRRSDDSEQPPWVELTVRRVRVAPADALLKPYESGLAAVLGEDSDLSAGSSSQTWVMAGTGNVHFTDDDRGLVRQGATLTVAFERSLKAVNMLAETTRMIARNTHARRLVKDSLDPSITWFQVDLETGELADAQQMRLHAREYNPVFAGYDPEEMHRRTADALGRRLQADASQVSHPFLVPRGLAVQAVGQLLRGEVTEAIVLLQTAIEGVFRGLHRMLMVDAGRTAKEIDGDDTPFRTLLATRLPALLGGSWTAPDSPVTRYAQHVYAIRNGIVHASREPDWSHMKPALDSYAELIDFLDARVAAKWRRHPRTLASWCDSWAGGTAPTPRAARAVVDRLREEPLPYWLPDDLAHR